MLIHKLKATALSFLLLATLATGAGYLTHTPVTARDEPRQAPAAAPAVIIEGRALAADTGRPIPQAVIVVRSDHGSGWLDARSRADALGRFHINPFPGGSFQIVVPPGKGRLLVLGPNAGYVLREIGTQE